MRLSEFIVHDMENILAEWNRFASTQGEVGANLSASALRDHAGEILQAIAKDILVHQSEDEQSEKSMGRAPRQNGSPNTAAEAHAIARAQHGFDINQLVGEYRALRASVLHRWERVGEPAATDLQDVRRFNEGIDQALAESIAYFNKEVNEDRNLLLGMLGHDFRNPLQAVQNSASYLEKLNAGKEVSAAAVRIKKSGHRLKVLLDDLLDYNRAKLGLGISIIPRSVDLADLFNDEVEQLRVTHPGQRIDLQVSGDVRGTYDPGRLLQLLGNLAVNALKYGAVDTPVMVELTGTSAEVVFAVKNQGPMIEPSALPQIFEPLRRGPRQQGIMTAENNLGLGLFIAREIVNAHGGQITAESNASLTVFTVRLPKTRSDTRP